MGAKRKSKSNGHEPSRSDENPQTTSSDRDDELLDIKRRLLALERRLPRTRASSLRKRIEALEAKARAKRES